MKNLKVYPAGRAGTWCLVVIILLQLGGGRAAGQDQKPKYLSIGKRGGSTVYFYDGQPVLSNEEFKHIVLALNDKKTTSMLERSQILHILAYPFSLIGTALAGWAIYKYYRDMSPGNTEVQLDYTSIAIGSGATVFGLVIGYKSKGLKRRCISRYNTVVKKRWEEERQRQLKLQQQQRQLNRY